MNDDDAMLPDVILRREALAAGYSERAIAHLVKSGEWVRIRRGGYTLGSVWRRLSRLDRHALVARCVVKQACTAVVLSHASALPEWGAPDFGIDLSAVHLTRRDHRAGRVEAGVRQHQGQLLDEDVVIRRGVEVTSATKTALDITTMTSTESALVIVNYLLHHELTTLAQLAERYASMSKDPYTLRTGLVLRLADGRLESVAESRTAYLCWRQGLPQPVPQHRICDDDGRELFRVDFAWPELKVFLEFDGLVKYTTLLRTDQTATEVLLAERRRQERIIELTGWRCVRLDWSDLDRPVSTARRIAAVLAQAAPAAS